MWGTKIIDRKAFALGLLWRIGLFVVVTVALPYAFYAYGNSSSCKDSPGSCQGVGLLLLVLYMGLGPLALVLLVISLLSPLVRRFRTIGISPWWTVFILLLILSNYRLLAYASILAAPSISGGAYGLPRPDFLFETIALLAVMAILPSRDGRVSLRNLGWPGTATIILAAFVTLGAALRAIDELPGQLSFLPSMRVLLRFLAWPTLVALVALPPVALYALWPREGQTTDTSAPPPRANPLPLVRIGLIAGALTLVAIFLGMQEMGPMVVIMLPAVLVPIGLPTFTAYALLVLTIYLLAVRRGPTAYASLAVTLVVFGSWGWQFIAKQQGKAADIDAVAAIEAQPTPTEMPATVLSEDANSRYTLLQRTDISTVLEPRIDGQYAAYVRGPNNRPEQSEIAVTSLPARYLKLVTDRESSFFVKGTSYEWDSPFELRLVDGTSNLLIGVWYERRFDLPTIPPILTFSGWQKQRRVSASPGEQPLKTFLDRVLGEASPPKS